MSGEPLFVAGSCMGRRIHGEQVDEGPITGAFFSCNEKTALRGGWLQDLNQLFDRSDDNDLLAADPAL